MVASSGPAVAHVVFGSITLWMAGAASVAIFLGHSAVSLFDQMSKEKKKDTAGSEADLVIRFGEIIASLESQAIDPENTDSSITSTLGVLEIVSRRVTKGQKGEIGVSLATYNGHHVNELKIRHRNPGNERPIGRKFAGTFVLGHHACQAGTDPRVVHDLRAFGKKACVSPTQSSFGYRSIFFIPLSRKINGIETPLGFISIDSTNAYAFYGNRANTVIVTCEPFINHIQDLLTKERENGRNLA